MNVWLKTVSDTGHLVCADKILSFDITNQCLDSGERKEVAAYVPAGNGQFYRFIIAIFEMDTDDKVLQACLNGLIYRIHNNAPAGTVVDAQQEMSDYVN